MNYVFTITFIVECILKLIAFGFKGYFLSNWNRFDFFVVMTSIIDFVMLVMGGSFSKVLRVGPQLARVIRVLRVSKLLRLVKSLEDIQKLIQTLQYSLPKLIDVLLLVFIVFFIFATLGVFLFKDVKTGVIIDNELINFQDFGHAMITLFISATGDDWHNIMNDVSEANA